jgi:pyrroloquinoline quinone biosynthesis protein B
MRRFFQSFFIALLLLAVVTVSARNDTPETKIIVLGTAQDAGIPQIGCEQEICRTQKRFVASLAIVRGDSVYLIDATPDLRQQHRTLVQRHPFLVKQNLFDAIFLTHAHLGHYTGLLFLGKESISTKNVPVYCSAQMAEFLKSNAPWNLLIQNGNIQLRQFEAGKSIDLGFQIIPLEVPHRKEFTDTYGFMIRGDQKSLLYISDIDSWEPIKDSLQTWFRTADYALLDGTFYSGNELPGRDIRLVPHPTIERSVELFQSFHAVRAQIFFTHLNHTNPLLLAQSPESKAFSKTGYRVAVDWQEFSL